MNTVQKQFGRWLFGVLNSPWERSDIFASFVARCFPTKRLSFPTNICRFRRALVVSYVSLSLPTSGCRFRQKFVASDKRFEANLSSTKKTRRESIGRVYVGCREGNDKHKQLSLFCNAIYKIAVDWTFWLRLSKIRQTVVGNDKRLLETTSACRKRQTIVGSDKRLSEATNDCRERQSKFLSWALLRVNSVVCRFRQALWGKFILN